MRRLRLSVLTVAATLLLAACGGAPAAPASPGGGSKGGAGTAPAEATRTLHKIIFGTVGTTSAGWPFFIAQKEGYFKRNGVEVDVVQTGGPAQAAQQLATGSVNIAEDGTDTWVRGVAQQLPVKIVRTEFITDPYTLITRAGINSWSQLKGKTVILGTRTDVTAISFEAMAAAQGLSLKDFTIDTAGSTNARYAALQSGHVDAAMLTQPFDFLSVSQGRYELATSKQYVPHWIFTTLAVNTQWAASHRDAIVAFIRSYNEGVQFAYAHRDAAIKILSDQTRVKPDIAQKAYDTDFNQWHAFSPDGAIDATDLQAVITAVAKQGTLQKTPSMADLYDPSYANAARGQ